MIGDASFAAVQVFGGAFKKKLCKIAFSSK
jgi:hypothetical protein